ncbi:MAG: YdcF family protein [Geobacteraceae bacterium]|nr:YdcF family protein [Geobacteraceae bacterium]
MSIVKGLFSLAVIILLALAVLFIDFAYKTFSVSQRNVKTDAIVVLAGGRGRVEGGVRLYREQQARYLFLIGVDPAVRKGDLYRERTGERGGEGVFLEKVSRNTLENALYARDLILNKEVSSIKLITSRYHMKRAVLLFRNTLPKDIAIYPHPVDTRNLKEEWWSHGGSFRLLFSEFYKYCLFRLFFLFAPGELRPGAIGSL